MAAPAIDERHGRREPVRDGPWHVRALVRRDLPPGSGRALRLVAFGVLWGFVMVGLELSNLPITSTESRPWYAFVAWHGLHWIWGGLTLSLALWWSTRGTVRWWLLACLLPVVALANGFSFVVWTKLTAWLYGFGISDPILEQPAPPLAIVGFVGWITLIYGGVAALIYALRRRIDQSTSALRALALARERNEAALTEERVRAMVERIEPRFLLDVLDAARTQYADGSGRAEATLDACTEFLRAAVPQIRSGESNVAAELALVQAYLLLRARISRDGRAWHLDRESIAILDDETDTHDLARVPMPPMALLPLLEPLFAMPAGSVDDPRFTIVVQADEAAITIRIAAPFGASLMPFRGSEWLAAVSRRLSRVCGNGASIHTEGAASRPHVVRLVIPVRAPPARDFPLERRSS